MKITLEHMSDEELEIIIKGDSSSEEVQNLINLLNSSGVKKAPKMMIGKIEDKEFVLPVLDVECFFTEHKNLYAKYKNKDYKVRAKLFEIENLYASHGFRRISKGVLLNCNYISYLEVEFSGNYTVVTKSSNIMTISRKYVLGVKQYIKEEM